MTAPTDAIAWLSERLRSFIVDTTYGKGISMAMTVEDIDDAATAIDALQARVKELEQERNVQILRALRAKQERDEAVALLVRVNALAQTQAWRRMPDGATFSTAPLAGDINATIRRLAGPDKEGK